MTQFAEFLKPEVLFSAENPFLKSARSTHKLFFDAFDKAARLQLAYAEELLDLNSKRFDVLYNSDSLMDAASAYQDLAFDLAKSAGRTANELQDVASELQFAISDAATELTAEEAAPKAKKAKAA